MPTRSEFEREKYQRYANKLEAVQKAQENRVYNSKDAQKIRKVNEAMKAGFTGKDIASGKIDKYL